MTDKTDKLSHEGLLALLDQLLSTGKYDAALSTIRDPINIQMFKDSAWELVPIISKGFTKDMIEKYPGIDRCCANMLEEVVEIAQPEEVLLELIEQAECQENNVKFIALLKPMEKCLNKLTSNREMSIDWCLSTMQDHIVNLPIPKNVGSGERRKLKDSDSWCLQIVNAYHAVLEFYKPFVIEVNRQICVNAESLLSETVINHRKSLVCFILQLLGKPLMHMDLHVKGDSKPSQARIIAEELVTDLSLLIGDLLMFFQYAESREIEGRCKMQLPPEDILSDRHSADVYQREYKVPTLSIGVLYYLVYAEGIQLDRLPCVYSPLYVFQNALYLATALLKRTDSEDFIIPKGLLLAQSVLSRVQDLSVPFQVLDCATHNNFFDALTMVSIYCCDMENRKLSITILRSYLFKFEMKGRYWLMWNIASCTSHPPLMGYLTLQLKDMIIAAIHTQNSVPVSPYFNGQRLASIVKKYIALPPGKFDLIDLKEQVLASLNILLYLFTRDKGNTMGILDHVKSFEECFLKPLKTAIGLSRADHNRRLQERENEKVQGGKKNEEEEPIVNLSIVGSGDVAMPEIENNEDIYLAFNTLDLMDNSLGMVKTCLGTRF